MQTLSENFWNPKPTLAPMCAQYPQPGVRRPLLGVPAAVANGQTQSLAVESGCWHPSANWVLGGVGEAEREDWEGFDGGGTATEGGLPAAFTGADSRQPCITGGMTHTWYSSPAKVYFYARQQDEVTVSKPWIHVEIWSCFKSLILLKVCRRGRLDLLDFFFFFNSLLPLKFACQYLKKLTIRKIQRFPGSTYALAEGL